MRWKKEMDISVCREGTCLYWDGEAVDYFYYVYSGAVKLQKTTHDGKELTMSLLGQGDPTGECGGLKNGHQCTGWITEAAEIGMIPVRKVEKLMEQSSSLAVSLMKWAGVMSQQHQSKFRDLLLYGRHVALASTLIRLSTAHGKTTEEGISLLLIQNLLNLLVLQEKPSTGP